MCCGEPLLNCEEEYCPFCSAKHSDLFDVETIRLWENSLSAEMTSEDSIRAAGCSILSATLPLPATRSVGGIDATCSNQFDFELYQELGVGGMGVVYTARQVSINRKVALKMVRAELQNSSSATEALMSEAVVTGCLDHPNVVPVYELGVDEKGRVFYAMKEVEGTPWSLVIKEKSLDDNLDILLRVSDTIAFAHSKGILHRDLKPQNIMLGAFGEIMVMDWGAACSSGDSSVLGLAPVDTARCGTPAYMAPEMAKADENRLGKTSDIYLLGAILYQILTGNPPRREKDPLICLLAASENKIDPLDEENELSSIALKAMCTAPADRYQSVEAFQQAIRDYRSHSESQKLLSSATAHFVQAKQKQEYELFNQANYGFREALELWDENLKAQALLEESIFEYAQCAFDKGDYELAKSLLDKSTQRHEKLLHQIEETLKEQASHKKRLRRVLMTVRILLALIALVFGVAFFMLHAEQKKTAMQREQARKEHRESLINLISAHYNEKNYEATVASFFTLYHQYGMRGLNTNTLLNVRVAAAMNPALGEVDSQIKNPLKIIAANQRDALWIIGKTNLQKIRIHSKIEEIPDSVVSIFDFSFGEKSAAGDRLKSVRLPVSITSAEVVHLGNDGTWWMGDKSIIYSCSNLNKKWINVLDMSQLTYPPLPKSYNIDRKAVEKWMKEVGRKYPITALLLNRKQTHAAVALGNNTICWVDLKNKKCLGWLAIGHGTRFGQLLTKARNKKVLLALSPKEDRLAYVSPVQDRSMLFSFSLPNMFREYYLYNRDHSILAVSYSASDQLYATLSTGYVVSPNKEFIRSFKQFYAGDDFKNDIRWAPERCVVRDLLKRNILLSTFSKKARESFNLSVEHDLFCTPSVAQNGFLSKQQIINRSYVDCYSIGDGKIILLDSNGILYLYEMQNYSLEAIPTKEKIVDICRGWLPSNFLIVSDQIKSNAISVVNFSSTGIHSQKKLLNATCESISCDPQGRWFAMVNKRDVYVYNRIAGKEELHFMIKDGTPSKSIRFDASGKYFAYGGGWCAGVRLFQTKTWKELLSILFEDSKKAYFTDVVIDHDNNTTTLLLTRGALQKLQSYSIHPNQKATFNWSKNTGSSPLIIVPFTDPDSKSRKYWCGLWSQEFKCFDAQTGATSIQQNYWRRTDIKNADFIFDDPRILFHATDGTIEMMLKTDLYPIFDPRILHVKIKKAVLNNNATRLYLLDQAGHLYSMKIPRLKK